MGRKKLTGNQKEYRKRKKSRSIGMKTFKIEAAMKEHLTQLTIDRVQTQGQIISDLIQRCLSYAVEYGKGGRHAKRKDRNVDTVRICVPLSSAAVKTLEEYCKLTGASRSSTVNRLIKAASLDPVLDVAAANALFTRKERHEDWVNSLRKEGWMTPQQKALKELEEQIQRELEAEYGPFE